MEETGELTKPHPCALHGLPLVCMRTKVYLHVFLNLWITLPSSSLLHYSSSSPCHPPLCFGQDATADLGLRCFAMRGEYSKSTCLNSPWLLVDFAFRETLIMRPLRVSWCVPLLTCSRSSNVWCWLAIVCLEFSF